MSSMQSYFNLVRLDDGIPEDHYSRFVVRFVDYFFTNFGKLKIMMEKPEGQVLMIQI